MAIERRSNQQLLLHGVVGGVLAGVVFMLAEMLISAAMGGPVFGPLRMIGSIVLGAQALAATFPLATAALVGLIVHLVLSAIYGVIFVYLVAYTRQMDASTGMLLLYGALFGFALWVINFLIVAPIAFPQFTMVDQFWMGFVPHTIFFGAVLGGYVAVVRPGRVERPAR